MYVHRLTQLQHFLERAELLQAARSDADDLTASMSAYEATVVGAVEALELEMDEEDEQRQRLASQRSGISQASKKRRRRRGGNKGGSDYGAGANKSWGQKAKSKIVEFFTAASASEESE